MDPLAALTDFGELYLAANIIGYAAKGLGLAVKRRPTREDFYYAALPLGFDLYHGLRLVSSDSTGLYRKFKKMLGR